MARQLPRVVQTLVTQTPDATRVRDTLTAAVQPTLDFLNGAFQLTSDGALRVLRQLVTQGAAFAGSVNVAGNLGVQGNVVFRATTANGFIIIPAGGGPAFYITNPGNTSALFIVDAAGNLTAQGVTAASLASANGISGPLDAGFYWNSSTTAGAYYRTQKPVVNAANGGNGLTDFIFKFPRAGSIVGYSLNNAGPVAGQNLLGYYKNGGQLVGLSVGAGGNNSTFWGTHSKGLYPFAAGDTLTVGVGNAAAGNLQTTVQLTVEMTA